MENFNISRFVTKKMKPILNSSECCDPASEIGQKDKAKGKSKFELNDLRIERPLFFAKTC